MCWPWSLICCSKTKLLKEYKDVGSGTHYTRLLTGIRLRARSLFTSFLLAVVPTILKMTRTVLSLKEERKENWVQINRETGHSLPLGVSVEVTLRDTQGSQTAMHHGETDPERWTITCNKPFSKWALASQEQQTASHIFLWEEVRGCNPIVPFLSLLCLNYFLHIYFWHSCT